jgi:hypothetical protein
MACGTNGRDPTWMIRSSIRKSAYMMGFKIWFAAHRKKWSFVSAGLAHAICAAFDIRLDRLTSLMDYGLAF